MAILSQIQVSMSEWLPFIFSLHPSPTLHPIPGWEVAKEVGGGWREVGLKEAWARSDTRGEAGGGSGGKRGVN